MRKKAYVGAGLEEGLLPGLRMIRVERIVRIHHNLRTHANRQSSRLTKGNKVSQWENGKSSRSRERKRRKQEAYVIFEDPLRDLIARIGRVVVEERVGT